REALLRGRGASQLRGRRRFAASAHTRAIHARNHRSQAAGPVSEVGGAGRATRFGKLDGELRNGRARFPFPLFQFHECCGVRAYVPRRTHAIPCGAGPPGRTYGDVAMKTTLALIAIAIAWFGGYGYGRWYLKP